MTQSKHRQVTICSSIHLKVFIFHASSNFPVFHKQVLIHAIPFTKFIIVLLSLHFSRPKPNLFTLLLWKPLSSHPHFSRPFMHLLSCFSQSTRIPESKSKQIGFSRQNQKREYLWCSFSCLSLVLLTHLVTSYRLVTAFIRRLLWARHSSVHDMYQFRSSPQQTYEVGTLVIPVL